MTEAFPIDDSEEHTNGSTCRCEPAVRFIEGGGMTITHNAFDGREGLEEFDEALGQKHKGKGWRIEYDKIVEEMILQIRIERTNDESIPVDEKYVAYIDQSGYNIVETGSSVADCLKEIAISLKVKEEYDERQRQMCAILQMGANTA